MNHLRLPDDCVRVRIEIVEDQTAIRAINEAAFGGQDEAVLVERLRDEGHALISLIAEVDAGIVGHIMFSRMWIQTPTALLPAVALAPIAVLPEYQRRGIGGCLIRHGLDLLRGRGEKIVIVFGHPDYYPRFGFSTDKARRLSSPFPADAFMAMELSAGALDEIEGPVVYPPAFGI